MVHKRENDGVRLIFYRFHFAWLGEHVESKPGLEDKKAVLDFKAAEEAARDSVNIEAIFSHFEEGNTTPSLF